MKFHEKSLELNITHELLNLTDSWNWFLLEPLWRRLPRHRLPSIKFPKSTCGGFHITTEGKSDPTGEAGGGYDVRIKSGIGGHLLFIQYKQGHLVLTSPDPKSIFNAAPNEHFKFKINSKSTNQHFLLRELDKGIGKKKNNAVVYALPLINDMNELEYNAGKLIRKTKFISIKDIDKQAKKNKVTILSNQEHNFRICKQDMKRCELNYYYFRYLGKDRTPEVIADLITLSFQKRLSFFLGEINNIDKNYNLNKSYIPFSLRRSFNQYLRYLLHYFEVNPKDLSEKTKHFISEFISLNSIRPEFSEYHSNKRDVQIINLTFKALDTFTSFINNIVIKSGEELLINNEIPSYSPSLFISTNGENGFSFKFNPEFSKEEIDNLNYLVI